MASAIERVERALSALKVFPLPSVVLFPGTVQPLHIFEPRYRAMVEDALAADCVIALAQLTPGFESAAAPRPALARTCCAGTILWHELLPDGRYNLALEGVSRVAIDSELSSTHAYREVKATLLADPPYAGNKEEPLRQAMFELAARLPADVAQSLLSAVSLAKGGQLADVVAGALVMDVARRQALLELVDVDLRLDEVLMDVGDVIARVVTVPSDRLLN